MYTLVLRNLSQHTKGSELLGIASEVKAMHVSIPLHRRSRAPKTWAYFAFKNESNLVAARDIIRSLKGHELVWDSVFNVKNFCVKCSFPSHKPEVCDAFSSRQNKPVPQYIIDNYRRFGHQPKFLTKDSSANHSNTEGSSFKTNIFSPNSSLRSRISYAEAASSLHNSMHAPNARNASHDSVNPSTSSDLKGKSVPLSNLNSLQDQISSVAKVLKDTISSFDRMNLKVKKWDNYFKKLDSRLNRVEASLNITIPKEDKYRSPELPIQSNRAVPSSTVASATASSSSAKATPSPTSQDTSDVPTFQEFNNMKEDINNIGDTLQQLQSCVSGIAQELTSINTPSSSQ
jgi:hypothetical protein